MSDAPVWIIGDIHGCAFQLDELLCQLDRELEGGERFVFLGDYIDRGPDSKRAVDLLLDFRAEHGERVTFLKGNHEQWFLEVFEDRAKSSWLLGMEGLTTVKSYDREAARALASFVVERGAELVRARTEGRRIELPYGPFLQAMPAAHLDFFRRDLRDRYAQPGLLCSHSGLDPELPFEDQGERELFWSNPKRLLKRWRGPELLAVGHLPTVFIDEARRGQPILGEWMWCLDTGVSLTGALTAARYPDGLILQARLR